MRCNTIEWELIDLSLIKILRLIETKVTEDTDRKVVNAIINRDR